MRGIALDGLPDFTEQPKRKARKQSTASVKAAAFRSLRSTKPITHYCVCGLPEQNHKVGTSAALWHACWKAEFE